jgi:hypothetical protein
MGQILMNLNILNIYRLLYTIIHYIKGLFSLLSSTTKKFATNMNKPPQKRTKDHNNEISFCFVILELRFFHLGNCPTKLKSIL